MNSELIYLDTYILKQDMRMRLPKTVLTNLGAEKSRTFYFYNKPNENELVLKVRQLKGHGEEIKIERKDGFKPFFLSWNRRVGDRSCGIKNTCEQRIAQK